MQIDPLETVIQWMKANLSSANGHVAEKQRYGEGWELSESGVSCHLDDASPDLYATVVNLRVEVRIYAKSPSKVMDVWMELAGLSRSQTRVTVATSKGNALLHYFNRASGLSMLSDENLGLDMGVVFYEAKIAEEAIT